MESVLKKLTFKLGKEGKCIPSFEYKDCCPNLWSGSLI